MKGPGMRLDLDVRRVWECPRCQRRRKTQGQIVSQVCYCTNDGTWMRLVEEKRNVRTIVLPSETVHISVDGATADAASFVSDDATVPDELERTAEKELEDRQTNGHPSSPPSS